MRRAREGAQTAAAMRGGMSNLQSRIFIAAVVVAVAVRSISIFPSATHHVAAGFTYLVLGNLDMMRNERL